MKTLRILTAIVAVALIMVLAVPTAQGQVMSKTVNFQDLVYYNGTNEQSWLEAIGPNVVKFIETFDQASWLDSASHFKGLINAEITPNETLLVNWTRYANPGTYVDSSFAITDSGNGGGILKIMTRKPITTNRPGGSIQGRVAPFRLDTAGTKHPLYFGIRLQIPDSLQRYQLFAGLAAINDTTTYDTTLVGVGFWKPASNLRTTLIDTFQTVIKSSGTAKTQDQITADSLQENTWEQLEFFFTGDSINFYHNGTLVKQRGSNIPTTARLTPTVDIRNIGTSGALGSGPVLGFIDWIRCIQINTP